jgi:hypothetical protein
MDSVPTCLQTPWRQSVKILPASATNFVIAASAGTTNANTAPTKVFGVIATNNDTIAHDCRIGINDPTGGFFLLGTVTLPINAGNIGTVPSVSLLNAIPALPLDETGQSYIFLNPTDTLQVGVLVSLNTGKEIDIIVMGADF